MRPREVEVGERRSTWRALASETWRTWTITGVRSNRRRVWNKVEAVYGSLDEYRDVTQGIYQDYDWMSDMELFLLAVSNSM